MPHGPVSHQPMELVERKGLGHPDSICDAMMEAIAVALSQAYIEMAGHVLHHNLDKGLLVAGRWLNSPACKAHFPEAGEDVKVMGCRQGRHLTLTIALAFVDRFIPNAWTYCERKAAIAVLSQSGDYSQAQVLGLLGSQSPQAR
jgi:S-adenosylmethionine synthetase